MRVDVSSISDQCATNKSSLVNKSLCCELHVFKIQFLVDPDKRSLSPFVNKMSFFHEVELSVKGVLTVDAHSGPLCGFIRNRW